MATRAQYDVVFYPVAPRDLYAGRVLCLPIPEDIIPYIIAALDPYTYPDAYRGDPADNQLTAIQVDHFRATLAARQQCQRSVTQPDTPPELGGGAMFESEDDMGNCITNVTIEDGIMYLWYGPCCKVAVSDFAGLVSPGGFTDPETVPTPDPQTEDASCRKASIVVDTLWEMANVYYDKWVSTIGIGYLAYLELKKQFPYVSWDYADLIVCNGILAASVLVNFDVDYSEEEQQKLKCSLAAAYDDTYVMSNDEFSLTKSHIRSALNVLSQEYLVAIYNSAGPGDWKTIASQSALLTGDPDCDCPQVADPLSIPTAAGWYMVKVPGECTVTRPAHASKWTGGGFVTTPLNDCFGIMYDVTITTATHLTPMNNSHATGGEDDIDSCGTFDNAHSDGNVDSSGAVTSLNRVVHGATAGFLEVMGAGTYNQISNGRTWSNDPASPDLTGTTDIDWYFRANPWKTAYSATFKNIYLLYNVNSPSHPS